MVPLDLSSVLPLQLNPALLCSFSRPYMTLKHSSENEILLAVCRQSLHRYFTIDAAIEAPRKDSMIPLDFVTLPSSSIWQPVQ